MGGKWSDYLVTLASLLSLRYSFLVDHLTNLHSMENDTATWQDKSEKVSWFKRKVGVCVVQEGEVLP